MILFGHQDGAQRESRTARLSKKVDAVDQRRIPTFACERDSRRLFEIVHQAPTRRSKYPGPRRPTSAKMAPCGSAHWTIQLPSGTSVGPLRTCPLAAFTRLTAASMLSTLK